tara:strand:+ start:1796 stop:2101 length:306 start_codon:yes stop_codon:yes gene_type:complete
MSREYTKKEVQGQFLGAALMDLSYWHNLPDKTCRERMEGLVFSFFVMLDGATNMPAFKVIPEPHPDDKEFNIKRDVNWFPDDCDIAGNLHEEWAKLFMEKK